MGTDTGTTAFPPVPSLYILHDTMLNTFVVAASLTYIVLSRCTRQYEEFDEVQHYVYCHIDAPVAVCCSVQMAKRVHETLDQQ